VPREQEETVEIATIDEQTCLEYDVAGDGEPVVFIHGAFVAEAFQPLHSYPTLTESFRLVLYHRRGYRGSSPYNRPVAVPEHAADAAGLLRYLGIGHAHIVGHSYGGAVALQLALEHPELVRTLALLEPALGVGESGTAYRKSLALSTQRAREEGVSTVLDDFLEARSPGYRPLLDQQIPGAFERTLIDASGVFEYELPALPDWTFGEHEARRIAQPALCILGGGSEALSPRFGETHRSLLAWLPAAEVSVLPEATHLMQVEDPSGLATALSGFWARHPIA
jgi:pimeloyl-ACP methyl ester carboxylesterase